MLTDGSGNGDLHGHLRSWDHGVVDVGNETRVHSIRKLHAGSVESRLSRSVVCRQECENDHISNFSLDLLRAILESTRTADSDLIYVS